MRRSLVLSAAVLAVGSVPLAGGIASGSPPSERTLKEPVLSADAPPAGCQHGYGRPAFHRVARRTFDGKAPATRFERRTLHRVIRCQEAPRKSRPIIRKHLRRYRNLHRYQLALRAIAPYPGPNGTRWAIPFSIVKCESTTPSTPQGGDWNVVNEIGALGPYQFNGWRVPWPVRTRRDKLAHHRMAAYLWADSHSHWAECL